MKKAQTPKPIMIDMVMMNIIKPHIAQLLCEALYCSMLSHF